MASSSVSHNSDSVDTNFEKNSRRSRIRTARARQINPSACRVENQAIGDTDDSTVPSEEVQRHLGSVSVPGDVNFGNVEHETSPKPTLRTGAGKEPKRPNKSHHVNKGKQQRDRRKLREKRRSTGVVHLASTESTGGSTTGDDEESSDAANAMNMTAETKRNTLENESITALDLAKEQLLLSSAGFRMQNSSSDLSNGGSVSFFRDSCSMSSSRCGCSRRRNKSPSDLEADDENDHDSLNQAEGATPCYSRYTSDQPDSEVTRVVQENRRLQNMVEEKDRRIHMLEFKVQQLMRDTLTISEEQARLQKENNSLLRALSKLTTDRNAQRKSKADET